jgi:hypothetical protein
MATGCKSPQEPTLPHILLAELVSNVTNGPVCLGDRLAAPFFKMNAQVLPGLDPGTWTKTAHMLCQPATARCQSVLEPAIINMDMPRARPRCTLRLVRTTQSFKRSSASANYLYFAMPPPEPPPASPARTLRLAATANMPLDPAPDIKHSQLACAALRLQTTTREIGTPNERNSWATTRRSREVSTGA